MENNLKDIYQIQKTLEQYGYFDISRISAEIVEYCEGSDSKLKNVLKRIKAYEPWEYIKGETEFLNNRFLVNKNTLIPRVETEQLVSIVTELLTKDNDYKYVIDVGTGSGCIIISLVKNLCIKNSFKFFATDINSEALKVAKENSMLHKVNERISFLKGNQLNGIDINNNVLIIANLPYIPTKIYKSLDKSVIDYEPKTSLDGGADGLKYYKELLKQIEERNLLKYKVTLLFEIEPSTLEDLKKIINKDIEVLKDYRELDRFVLIHLS